MTTITRTGLALATLLAAAALAGCGNAYEQISVGPWQEVGTRQLPELFTNQFAVETTQPGTGRTVNAGDLVEARLQMISSGAREQASLPDTSSRIMWLWVGREPKADTSEGRQHAEFGMLGSPNLRAAFVGRRLHEKFTLKLWPGQRLRAWVPAHAFLVYLSQQPQIISNSVEFSALWPDINLDGLMQSPGAIAEVEVLQACEATLSHRTAYLQQWGAIFGWGDFRPPSVRAGTLGWSKIDARCPPPDGDVTLQVGPLYSSERTYVGQLYEWRDSYRRLRPPGFFREEWMPAPLPDVAVSE